MFQNAWKKKKKTKKQNQPDPNDTNFNFIGCRVNFWVSTILSNYTNFFLLNEPHNKKCSLPWPLTIPTKNYHCTVSVAINFYEWTAFTFLSKKQQNKIKNKKKSFKLFFELLETTA